MLALLLLSCCLSVPPDITLDADTITLGAIVPFPSGDPRAALSLGYAPQPGLARRFMSQELVTKLRSEGLSSDDLQFPDSVLVHRKAQSLDPQAVSEAVRAALQRQYPDSAITIRSVEIPAVPMATGVLELSASIPAHTDIGQPVFVRLDVRANGSVKAVFVRAVAEIERPQPVLRSAVAAHSAVGPEDVEWKVMSVRGPSAPISSLDDLRGVVARRDLQVGEVLTESLFYSPIMIRKGDSVTVKASTGGVTIAAIMRAKGAGRLGETIVVEHLSGVGTTSARVVGPGLLIATQGAK